MAITTIPISEDDAPIVLGSFRLNSDGHRIDRRSDGMSVLVRRERVRDVVVRQHHTRTFADIISGSNLTYVRMSVCLIVGVIYQSDLAIKAHRHF